MNLQKGSWQNFIVIIIIIIREWAVILQCKPCLKILHCSLYVSGWSWNPLAWHKRPPVILPFTALSAPRGTQYTTGYSELFPALRIMCLFFMPRVFSTCSFFLPTSPFSTCLLFCLANGRSPLNSLRSYLPQVGTALHLWIWIMCLFFVLW